MMRTIYIILVLGCLFQFNLFSQSPDLLKATGPIPEEFISRSISKYEKQVEELSAKKFSRKDKKSRKQFLLESNFLIDDILQSGMVLFNDPASIYANDVLSKLPVENKKLIRKKPRVYILNSAAVNAFATDQGIIFVTLGLLSKLENEAQLAFILSHELVHIQHRHSINKFVHTKDVDKGNDKNKDNINQVAIDRNIFKKSLYSRKLEEEADKEGLELFLKSDYAPQVILNVFKILNYAYLPFDNKVFEKDFFEDANYQFPDHFWLDTLNEISPMEMVDVKEDKSATHPSSQKRLKALKSKIEDLSSEGKKSFLVSENRFQVIKEKARYQIPYLNLYIENFPEAIYTSYLLLKKYPNDIELKKVIGKALYLSAKYKNDSSDNKTGAFGNIDEIEGELQQVYHFLSSLEKKELSILATKYNWSLLQEAPDDSEVKQITEDLFTELARHFDSLDDFKKEPGPAANIAKDTTEEDSYWRYAFVEELENEPFAQYHKNGMEKNLDRSNRAEYYDSAEGIKKYKKIISKERRHGKSLGINKVVIVNPFYLSLDERKNKGVQYVRGEEKQEYFSKALDKYSKFSNVEVDMLDVHSLSENDVDKFNDIITVNQYFKQQLNHYNLTLTPSFHQNEVDAIAQKYGTDYFLWTGVIALKEKNDSWKQLLPAILAPYIIPLLIPSIVTPEYDMLYYAILFDVKTGRNEVIKMDFFNKRDSKTLLNAHMYDVFYQIGRKKK